MNHHVRAGRPDDSPRLIEIWCCAVDATHHFLSPLDRITIEREVHEFFPLAKFTVACDDQDVPIGFMLMDGTHLEALFIHPDHHGRGLGKTLLGTELGQANVVTADVNEANHEALGFYKRLGFEVVGRSELDSQGRQYPLLHLKRYA